MVTALGEAMTEQTLEVADQIFNKIVEEVNDLYAMGTWQEWGTWQNFCLMNFQGMLAHQAKHIFDVPPGFWSDMAERIHKAGMPHEHACQYVAALLVEVKQ